MQIRERRPFNKQPSYFSSSWQFCTLSSGNHPDSYLAALLKLYLSTLLYSFNGDSIFIHNQQIETRVKLIQFLHERGLASQPSSFTMTQFTQVCPCLVVERLDIALRFSQTWICKHCVGDCLFVNVFLVWLRLTFTCYITELLRTSTAIFHQV